MKTSENGIALIQGYEGLELKSYLCPAKIWTIGYGHTQGVKQGQEITPEQAISLLKGDLLVFEQAVKALKLELNQAQFDALVSFAYNVGVGALNRSTLVLKARKDVNDPSIRNEFMRWNKAAGKELAGLTRRRKAEADLYFS